MWALDRRALLQRAAAVVGSALALDLGFEAFTAQAANAKTMLDAPRFALLSAVSDTIIPNTATPGALEAGVPKLVDAVIATWATPQHRAQIVRALDKIDSLAREQNQRGFAQLAFEQRTALLTPYDIQALKMSTLPAEPLVGPLIEKAPTKIDPQVGRARQESVQDPGSIMTPRYTDPGYGKLKELIVVLFYCTETALTHDLAYEHSPGEWRPSIPITSATRPWGGYSLI